MISDNYVTGDNIYLRELQNFFFEVLGMMSITHYGAIGDGRRDNYGPLQVAIDDANRRGLSFLYVPYGKFIYTGELQNLIDPDTGKQRIIFMGNPHAKIVNIRTGVEIEIHQFGWCSGHDTSVTTLTENIELRDGVAPTLVTGFYFTANHTVTSQPSNKQWIGEYEVFYYDAAEKTFATPMYNFYYTVDENRWEVANNGYITDEIVDNRFLFPTSRAVKDYVNSHIPSTSSAITAYLPSDYSSTGETIEDIPLAEKTKIGSGLTVNNDGEIEIGSGITKVLVSGSIRSNVQTIMVKKRRRFGSDN